MVDDALLVGVRGHGSQVQLARAACTEGLAVQPEPGSAGMLRTTVPFAK
jgi:hypothetical protein